MSPLLLASRSLQPGLSHAWPQQGVGPELLEEGQGQGQGQVQAAREQGRKRILPAHSEPVGGGHRDKRHSWHVYFGT